jgi:hypothetical protein
METPKYLAECCRNLDQGDFLSASILATAIKELDLDSSAESEEREAVDLLRDKAGEDWGRIKKQFLLTGDFAVLIDRIIEDYEFDASEYSLPLAELREGLQAVTEFCVGLENTRIKDAAAFARNALDVLANMVLYPLAEWQRCFAPDMVSTGLFGISTEAANLIAELMSLTVTFTGIHDLVLKCADTLTASIGPNALTLTRGFDVPGDSAENIASSFAEELKKSFAEPIAEPTDKFATCGFCGRARHEVGKLVAGPNLAICNYCIDLCTDIIAEPVEPQPE